MYELSTPPPCFTYVNNSEINIRISKVLELKERNSINRWEMMRCNGSGISVSLQSRFEEVEGIHSVALTVGTRYFGTRSQMRHDILDYNIRVYFEIESFDSLRTGSGNDISLPPSLMTLMYGVAIGALRGMLAQRLAGTMLEAYPLPLVNISELVSRHLYGNAPSQLTIPLEDFRYN